MIEKTVTYQEMDVDEVKEPKGRHMIEFKVAFWTDKVNGEELPLVLGQSDPWRQPPAEPLLAAVEA
jgi:hypothetical protein